MISFPYSKSIIIFLKNEKICIILEKFLLFLKKLEKYSLFQKIIDG